MRKFLFAATLLLAASAGSLNAQLIGTKNIPGDYASLDAAIADLNLQGVGAGGVTLNLVAGNPQIAPAGGYQVTTLTGTATNTIVIVGNNNTITASPAHVVGALNDAIFKIIGADYVTIGQFILTENPANTTSTPTASNTMTEWGVALLHSSTTEGAQHNNVAGNIISLNRTYGNTWGVYSNARHSATAVTSTQDPASVNGTNSFNTVYGNMISNVNYGIAFIGATSATFMDSGNDVGGAAALTGNVITNWGGLAAPDGYVSNSGTSYGIFMNHQTSSNVSYNSLTSAAVTPTVTFRGIVQDFTSVAPTGTFTNLVTHNSVTLQSGQTSGSFRGIECISGNANMTLLVDNNTIQNCSVSGAASSTNLVCISVSGTASAVSISNNIIQGNSSSATTGGFSGVQCSSGITNSLSIDNNQVGTASGDAITFSAATSGNVNGITSAAGSSTCTVSISNNNIQGMTHSVNATSAHTYISQSVTVLNTTISSNTFTNLTAATSGSVTFISNSAGMASGGSTQLLSNAIVTGFSKSVGGGILTLYNNTNTTAPAGTTRISSNNNFSGISVVAGTAINGWNDAGGGVTGTTVKTITNNTFSNWTGNAGGISVIVVNNSGDGTTVSNNTISGIASAAGLNGIQLGSANGGAVHTCSDNVITGLTSAGGNISGLVLGSGNVTTMNVSGNTIGTVLTATGTSVSGINMTGGQTVNIFANKIYDLENDNSAGLMNGIAIAAGATVNIYNNLIGDLRLPSANASFPLNGINIVSSSAVNLHYNTIFLNATSTGTDFGSSGIYADPATTVELINNFVVNQSTANGTGLTVAYRRGGTSLATYSGTSDHNSFYAGSPSPVNLVFHDGTSGDQTLTAYRTRVTPRDVNSISENPPLMSYSGVSPNFLHVAAATATLLESGGVVVASTVIDFDGDARPGPAGSVNGGAVAPDIGADEFDGLYMLCAGTPSAGASAGAPASYCASGSFTLTLTGHSTGPGISYQWQESAVTGGPYTNIVGATSDNYITPSITSTMYYVCVVTCSASGLSATSAEITATINPDPVVSILPASASICQPGATPVTLTASGANTYAWSPGTGLSSTTTASTDALPLSTITYTVTGTSAAGCTGTAMVTVTVNSLPSVTASASPTAICAGSSTTLTASGAATYNWMPGSLTGSSVADAPASSTTYTVTGTDANGCTATAVTSVTVNPLPAVNASTTSPVICAGENTTLNASGANSYLWMPGSLSGSSVNDAPASTTTYTVTGTDVNGCTDTDVITITVNPLPTVTATATPGTICAGATVTLDGFGANTYSWMPGSLSGATVTDTPASTTTYTVTGTDVNGCTGTGTAMVNVTPLPVIFVGAAPGSVCIGNSTTLSASGASTYTWMPGSLSGTPVTDSPVATTTYTVTGDDGTGCTSTATITITVNPLPTVDASSAPAVICSGENTTLTGSGASSYAWMPGSLSGSPVTDAPTVTTTYTVTGTDVNGCTGTANTTVTVNPSPTVTVTATTNTICEGSNSLLSASGATTYTWMPGAMTGTNVVVSPAATTTYTVTGDDGSGCTSSATITITVNPRPNVNISGASTYCEFGSTVLTSSPGIAFQWYLNGVQLAGATSNTHTANAAGIYNVVVTNGAGCSDSAATGHTLTELPAPAVSFTASPSLTVCAGTSLTLSGTGAVSYTWSGGITDGSPFTVVASSSYTVTGTDVNGCTNTAVASVTVNPVPTVSAIATPASTVCAGATVTLNGSGAVSYTWTGGVTDGVPFTASTTTTYTVTGTDANGCTNTDAITVNVNALPALSIISTPGTTVCDGTPVTLTGSGAMSYSWTGGVTNGVPFTPLSTSSYTVTGTDGNGCQNTASVTITVNPNPVVNFTVSPGTTVCAGSSVMLSGTGASTYAWTGGVTDGVAFTPVSTDSYTVTGTAANGCTATASVTITVNPLPTVSSVAAPGTSICAGNPVQLNGTGAASYVWSGGVTDGISFVPASTTTYTVTGTDVNGCTGTSTITITVNPLPTVGTIASPGTNICTGSSVTLNGTGAATYSWSGGVTDGVAFVPPSTSSYVVTGTDVSGCTNTATVTITVNPLPVVSSNISPANTVCQGTMVTLTGSGASTYAWTGGVTDGVPFAASTTTTYTVTGTDANGCTATATQSLTVNPAPLVTANASPSASVCNGTMVTLSGSGATTYTWSGGITDNVPFSAVSTTTYTVTGTDGIGCSNTATITITVNPQPNVSSVASPGTTVCAGTAVTLNGTGATSYAWSGGVTDGVAFTPASTTTYTVTGTDANGCSNTSTTTIIVNPVPSISASASPSATVCQGTMVTMNGFGGSTYSWTGGITDNVPFAASTTTTYTVTGTDMNGCTGTAAITLTVNPSPLITATQTPSGTVCAGNSIALNGGGGTSYTWSGGVTNGVSFVPASTTTYTVTGTGAAGCTNTATITVTVVPLPVVSASVSPGDTVCNGTMVTLSGSGAATYAWTGGRTNNVPFAATISNTYTVTGTDANGCTGTATQSITVNPNPVVSSTASPATAVCAGTSVTLSGTGAATYNWSGGVTDNVAFTPTSTTTYTVTGTGVNGCTASATTTITVNPLPVVGTSAAPAPLVCSGTMVTLNGTGAATYAWSGGVSNNVPFSAATTTTYTVTGTDGNGCSDTAVTTVTVNPTPTVSFTASPGVSVCVGTEITLDGTGAVTYTWSDSIVDGNPFTPVMTDTFMVVGTDGNGCMDSAVAIITVNAPPVVTTAVAPSDTVCENAMITLSGSGATTYAWSHGVTDNVAFAATVTTTYTVIGSNGAGCADTTTQTVTVIPGPVVTISGNSTFCTGGSTLLTAPAAGSYQWYMNGSPVVGATSPSYTATVAGMYNVWIINASGCGDSSATGVNVTINTPPVVTASATAAEICRGASVTLTGGGAVTYAWSAGVNNGVPFAPLNTLTYTVVGTASNGCTDSETITVVVNSLPVVSSTANPGYSVCENTAVTLNGTGAATYVWTGGVMDGMPFTPLATSSYSVTGTDTNGCSNSASVTVTVNPNPVVTLGADVTQCGGSVMLDAGNAGATYAWSNSATTQMISVTTTATYFVEVTNAFGCSASDTVSVTINTQPLVVLGADDTLCTTSVTLDAMNPGATYLWNDMSTGQTNMVTVSGTYFVTATMPGGCTSSDTITLVLHTPPSVTLSLVLDTVCLNSGAVALSGETPSGGAWSGPGVSGSSFDPMISGAGTFGITYLYTDTNGCSSSAIDSIFVDPCLAVEEQVSVADFSLYPNPNNGDFNITISGTSSAVVTIYNAAGQLVKTERVMNGEALAISLEASGMYLVTIMTEEGETVTKRVVVER